MKKKEKPWGIFLPKGIVGLVKKYGDAYGK